MEETKVQETEVTETESKETEAKETEDKKSTLINLDNLTSADLDKLYSENEIVKQYIEKQKDSHFSKSLKTWKQNNLAAEVEKEIAKRFPAETAEQKRIRELEQEMANMKKSQVLEKMTNKALTTLAITPGVSVIFEPIKVTFAHFFLTSYSTLYFFKILHFLTLVF